MQNLLLGRALIIKSLIFSVVLLKISTSALNYGVL